MGKGKTMKNFVMTDFNISRNEKLVNLYWQAHKLYFHGNKTAKKAMSSIKRYLKNNNI